MSSSPHATRCCRKPRLYWEPSTDKIIEAEVITKPSVSFGAPREALTADADLSRGWDVSADGKSFLVVHDVANGPSATPNLAVVQNWFAEYKR